MNGLLQVSERRGVTRFPQSISGFAALKQKTRLILGAAAAPAVCLAVACVAALAMALTAGASLAADPYGRNKATQRAPAPIVRPMPLVVKPMPSLSARSRVERNRDLRGRSDFYRRSSASSACRSNCGASCQTIACSGLSGSQCASIRQQCRLSCRSRC